MKVTGRTSKGWLIVAGLFLPACASPGQRLGSVDHNATAIEAGAELNAALARIDKLETKIVGVNARTQSGDVAAIKTGDSEGVTTWMLAGGLVLAVLASGPFGAICYWMIFRRLRMWLASKTEAMRSR